MGDERPPPAAGDELDLAVAHVLPVINLSPAGFATPPGFQARAARRTQPTALALSGVDRQLVYVGTVEDADPFAAADHAARAAVDAMREPVRAACTQLIVAWTDRDGRIQAAAFALGAADAPLAQLGFSWVTPDRWPQPMIDASRSDERLLDEMLERVAHAIAGRRSSGEFEADFERATRLVDLEFVRRRGEGQSVRVRPTADASDVDWDAWFERYTRSAHDEWRRTGGPGTGLEVQKPEADGPLSGMHVFISYARPDATSMAWPVRDALRKAGASVWFDQERSPDEEMLDAGIAQMIASCDAYVMCASNEFIERAGYATQEIAWALQAGGGERRSVIVAEGGTILPTAIAGWPKVPLGSPDLADGLIRALRAPPAPLPDLPAAAVRAAPAALPAVADLTTLRARVAHVRRFDEVPANDVTELAAGRGKHLALVRRRLLDVGAGLSWSGTLADMDAWPSDPMIRDLRWRLAGDRALVGTAGALTEEWAESPDVTGDVRIMALEPVPIPHWHAANGWADEERRFALRHHIGRLRMLEELIRRGLCLGLLLGAGSVPDSVLDEWTFGMQERRRECLDALVALRLAERLSWARDPPTWDRLWHAWLDLVAHLPVEWPARPRAVLRAAADDLAAVAAETTWWAVTHGAAASQSFTRSVPAPATTIDVYAAPDPEFAPSSTGGPRLALGLIVTGSTDARVKLSWTGFGDEVEDGAASAPAPEMLAQAIAWRSRAISSGVQSSLLT